MRWADWAISSSWISVSIPLFKGTARSVLASSSWNTGSSSLSSSCLSSSKSVLTLKKTFRVAFPHISTNKCVIIYAPSCRYKHILKNVGSHFRFLWTPLNGQKIQWNQNHLVTNILPNILCFTEKKKVMQIWNNMRWGWTIPFTLHKSLVTSQVCATCKFPSELEPQANVTWPWTDVLKHAIHREEERHALHVHLIITAFLSQNGDHSLGHMQSCCGRPPLHHQPSFLHQTLVILFSPDMADEDMETLDHVLPRHDG